MTSTALEASPAPLPALKIVQRRHRPERWTPETFWLTVLKEDQPATPTMRILIALHNHRTEKGVTVDLITNSDSFAWIRSVVRQHFGPNYCIESSWETNDRF